MNAHLEIRLVPKALLSIVDGLLTDKDISQEKSWTTDEKGNEKELVDRINNHLYRIPLLKET